MSTVSTHRWGGHQACDHYANLGGLPVEIAKPWFPLWFPRYCGLFIGNHAASLTANGQADSSSPLGRTSEVWPMPEAVKVEGRTPDRPLTDFGQLWTDRRQYQQMECRGSDDFPDAREDGYHRPARTRPEWPRDGEILDRP